MARYSLLLLLILGSAATAIAAIAPQPTGFEAEHRNVTIIEKNQAFPLIGPLVVEECETPDCAPGQG